MNSLSEELLEYIFNFVEFKHIKKVEYRYPDHEIINLNKNYFIKKINFIPPIICCVCFSWNNIIKLSICNICKKDRYNFNILTNKNVCNNCGHVRNKKIKHKYTQNTSKRKLQEIYYKIAVIN